MRFIDIDPEVVFLATLSIVYNVLHIVLTNRRKRTSVRIDECEKHLQRLPTGFSFGILVIPSKIPPSFGIPFVCCELALVGGGGLDGALEFDVLLLLLLLLPLAFAMRPVTTGPLLSTVVVFFSFAPCWMLSSNADLLSGPPEMPVFAKNG